MIKIAIQVKSTDPAVQAFLQEEIEAVLDRLAKDMGADAPPCRMDTAFHPYSTARIPTHEEVESIIM